MHDLVVDALHRELGGPAAHRVVVPRQQFGGELLLRLADGTARRALKLDRQICHPTRGDVGCDVDLAPPHDALINDTLTGGWVEPWIAGDQTGALQGPHEVPDGFGGVDPAQVLPDRQEVLDVVDQRGAGQRHEQWTTGTGADSPAEF